MIKLANKIALASILEAEEWMEKKALNLASLLRMSRNAATKGKLRRFSDLLDKRNLAIDNVARARAGAIKQQSVIADMEKALIGDGPEMKAYQRLLDRSIAADGYPTDPNRIIKFRSKESPNETDLSFAKRDLYQTVAGPWNLENLAAYSRHQHPSNPMDKLTYPGL